MSLESDEAIHGGIVVIAMFVLAGVIAITSQFAAGELQIVLYSGIYVGGVCAFWLGYLYMRRRSDARREALLDR